LTHLLFEGNACGMILYFSNFLSTTMIASIYQSWIPGKGSGSPRFQMGYYQQLLFEPVVDL
jgi:hypothetical protein